MTACLILAFILVGAPAQGAQKPWIGVRGNKLVDATGATVRLLGVNRAGSESQCVHRAGFFLGPVDQASIAAMKKWGINAVRVPLNESCWLGISFVPPAFGGTVYREEIHRYVRRLEHAGLYVILDLQWASPGTYPAEGLLNMPDADHSPEFWRSLATEYVSDRSVLFDVFNEPRPGVDWNCWKNGCEINNPWIGKYQAVGMQQLVETIRATGATQPIMLAGLDWASNLNGWLSHLPYDPDHALVASNHTYNLTACQHTCRKILSRIARTHPVVTGELGETGCKHRYIDHYMPWADREGISYLGWAWTTGPEWGCSEGPSLIRNYAGAPTNFGKAFRDHLLSLRRSAGR